MRAGSGGDLPGEGSSAAPGAVAVDIVVPGGWTAFGDGVRLVGSTPELGAWDPHSGLALSWQEGGSWAARAALPPGTAAFKLVRLRADGGVEWEGGEDRALSVPALPEPAAACATLRLECAWGGGPASTRAALAVDRAAVEELVARTAARVAELTAHRQALAARVAELEAEVEVSSMHALLVGGLVPGQRAGAAGPGGSQPWEVLCQLSTPKNSVGQRCRHHSPPLTTRLPPRSSLSLLSTAGQHRDGALGEGRGGGSSGGGAGRRRGEGRQAAGPGGCG